MGIGPKENVSKSIIPKKIVLSLSFISIMYENPGGATALLPLPPTADAHGNVYRKDCIKNTAGSRDCKINRAEGTQGMQ